MTDRADDFNRTDRNLDGDTLSDGISAWTEFAGGIAEIVSNRMASTGGGSAWIHTESSVSNVDVRVTSAIANRLDLFVRLADASNFLRAVAYSDQIEIYKYDTGTPTLLASVGSITQADGDVWKMSVTSANDITVYQNGVSKLTTNSSFGSTNTKHGIGTFGAPSVARLDNFFITEIIPDTLMGQACL